MFLVKLSISSFNESSRVFSILNLESSIFTTSAVLLSARLQQTLTILPRSIEKIIIFLYDIISPNYDFVYFSIIMASNLLKASNKKSSKYPIVCSHILCGTPQYADAMLPAIAA